MRLRPGSSLVLAAALVCALLMPGAAAAHPPPAETAPGSSSPAASGPVTGPTGSFRLVGHDPLLNRGMNAAIAIHGDYAYIGSRTDTYGDPGRAGILIVNIADPSNPTVVGKIAAPLTANPGESSRELRVWPSKDILIVLHTNCGGPGAHECTPPSRNSFRFFDISGSNATNPKLITELDQNTHEFFLWQDPANPSRALMFGGSAGSNNTAFSVWDISPVARGEQPITVSRSTHGYSRVPATGPVEIPVGGLHSLTVSNDGRQAYFALLTGGFAVADVSDFTAGVPNPVLRPITANETRPVWPGPGTHSALKLFGRDWVYASDEVYGSATAPGHGCPWGWARMIDIANPVAPTVESEYRLPPNVEANCDEWEPRPRTSYSAHNPTATPNVVFTTWHSSGVQAISVADPRKPYQLAAFMPQPLPRVAIEDPRLSSDPDTGRGEKVVMWSFPIIKDGLIYVVDLRNGLYVLQYEGPHEGEVAQVGFLEGNSNLGHALCFEPVGTAPASCRAGSVSAQVATTLNAVTGMRLHPGTANPLRNTLRGIAKHAGKGKQRQVCGAVDEFRHLVDDREEEGKGKGLTALQATQLRTAAIRLASAAGCGT